MSNSIKVPRDKQGTSFALIIGALCIFLVLMIGYVFYSLSEVKQITPQPYVTIINNNISAKGKILVIKNEVLLFANKSNARALSKLKMKVRVYHASILQDFQSERTLEFHRQYGNVERLAYIRQRIDAVFNQLQQFNINQTVRVDSVLLELDKVYGELNTYLSTFVSNVQKNQMQFIQHKEDFYARQYLYLTLILSCSIVMIGVISWMYLNQSKLSRNLKERSEKLTEAKHLAEQSATTKARFLANMSHEMRTPLNAIIGLSEKEYYLTADEQTRNFISMINNSGLHLLKLINSVLDISKIEKGKMKLEKERFYCSELIEQAKTIFVDNSKKEVEVFFSCQLVSNVELLGDKTKLVQLMHNLSFNAHKFTDKGYVNVSLTIEESSPLTNLVLQVSDTGIGMSTEHLNKVFDEFTQADDSINRRYGGTGLGLAICQSLVNLMGGQITVQSELNVGTQFRVTIPIETDSSKAIRYFNHGQQISVVSENAYARQLISSELQRFGLYSESGDSTVYFHSSGTALDEALLKQQPCVVICDRETPINESQHLTKLAKPYDVFTLLNALGCSVNSEPVSPQSSSDQTLGHSVSALIVEDIRVNQVVAQKMLNTLQDNTVTVDNGQECLDILKQQQFDLIFMDIQMPVMDGIEALKTIRQHDLAPDTAIVALTANTFGKEVINYLEMGFNDVLPKPLRLDLMKRVLAKYG